MATITKYDIDIDGYIGAGAYSKEYVKSVLDSKKGVVTLRMSSPGGSLVHGLGIADRIGEHGNVEAYLFGFNASSATIALLKAKKVSMASNGFYLIHKVMNPVDVYGNLNADEIAQVIADLLTNKEENDMIDKVMAQMYVDKTQKPLTEILDIMKVGGWLTAEEALSWGFVDEVFQSTEKINMKSMESKLNVFGLPTNKINEESLFTNQICKPMKKQFAKVNTVIGVEALEASEEGVFLNEAQIEALDSNITNLEANVATLTTENATAQAATTEALATAATQTARIAELEQQVTNLQAGAGASTTQVVATTDEEGEGQDNSYFQTLQNAREMMKGLPE